MERYKKYFPYGFLFFTILFAGVIWYFVYTKEHISNILKVSYLDIGQGDSIYIEAPNGSSMLIDGGPTSMVLSKLSQVIPWGRRSVDIVLATHADADHIGGLPDVLDHFHVSTVIENGATSDTKIYQRLEEKEKTHHVKKVIAHKGMRIILDTSRNIYFDILFPDRDISNFESNDGSIVGRLVYGDESFMMTGDATKYTENLIMQTTPVDVLHSQVLKLGHHGSHTSSSQLWLEKVHPDMAIISAGLNNRYGHPHKDTLDMLDFLHIPYRATYKEGTIMYKTDGITMWH